MAPYELVVTLDLSEAVTGNSVDFGLQVEVAY